MQGWQSRQSKNTSGDFHRKGNVGWSTNCPPRCRGSRGSFFSIILAAALNTKCAAWCTYWGCRLSFASYSPRILRTVRKWPSDSHYDHTVWSTTGIFSCDHYASRWSRHKTLDTPRKNHKAARFSRIARWRHATLSKARWKRRSLCANRYRNARPRLALINRPQRESFGSHILTRVQSEVGWIYL
jgi:hypothetical protein